MNEAPKGSPVNREFMLFWLEAGAQQDPAIRAWRADGVFPWKRLNGQLRMTRTNGQRGLIRYILGDGKINAINANV